MRRAFLAGATCVAMLAAVPAASALNARTWVSGKGTDQAGCGPIATPCRSLQFAHDQTNAGGEIDVLDGAGYGALVITKSISIVNDGAGLAGVLAPGGGRAIEINAQATDAILLKGLTVEGAGTANYGVFFNSGRKLTMSDCLVTGFAAAGILLNPSSPVSRISISSTKLANNSSGLGVITSLNSTDTSVVQIDNVVANNNQYGMTFYIQNAATNVGIVNSVTSANEFGGIYITQTSNAFATFMLDGLTSNSNDMGLFIKAGSANRAKAYLARSTIMGNNKGVVFDSANPAVLSFGNNHIVTNNTDVFGGTLGTVAPR